MRYDVAVIGAGPAGALCAQRLARAGARVALVDDSHPREKPCGGGVTGRALAFLADGGKTSGVPIESAVFAYSGQTAEVAVADDTRSSRIAVFPRSELDAQLLQRAAEAGATVIPERAVDVNRQGTSWTIHTRTPGTRNILGARWLVGADGPNSMVRKRVSSPFTREDLSIACGYYVLGLTSTRIDIVFEDDPPGYLWSFPRRDHLAVGICAQADATSVAHLMPAADRWIAANAAGGRLERYSWPIPSLGVGALERERPEGDAWMLVGDAAGLVDPITREGIYFALESGAAAAASITESSGAQRYTQRLRDTIYRELTTAARIKARFYRPAFMRLMMSGLKRSGRIRRVMADLIAGDQPYATLRGRLLKTMEWRLAMELFLKR